MADITMCNNKTCPLRSTCYRFKATASKHRQSYATFTYRGAGCIEYWPMGTNTSIREL